jgi:hypothetical protein
MNQTAHIPIQGCWQILSLIRLVWKLSTSDLHLFKASANVDEGQWLAVLYSQGSPAISVREEFKYCLHTLGRSSSSDTSVEIWTLIWSRVVCGLERRYNSRDALDGLRRDWRFLLLWNLCRSARIISYTFFNWAEISRWIGSWAWLSLVYMFYLVGQPCWCLVIHAICAAQGGRRESSILGPSEKLWPNLPRQRCSLGYCLSTQALAVCCDYPMSNWYLEHWRPKYSVLRFNQVRASQSTGLLNSPRESRVHSCRIRYQINSGKVPGLEMVSSTFSSFTTSVSTVFFISERLSGLKYRRFFEAETISLLHVQGVSDGQSFKALLVVTPFELYFIKPAMRGLTSGVKRYAYSWCIFPFTNETARPCSRSRIRPTMSCVKWVGTDRVFRLNNARERSISLINMYVWYGAKVVSISMTGTTLITIIDRLSNNFMWKHNNNNK